MNNKIEYNGQILEVRGGAWLENENTCFYTVIDKIKDFNICKENGKEKIFALPNFNN